MWFVVYENRVYWVWFGQFLVDGEKQVIASTQQIFIHEANLHLSVDAGKVMIENLNQKAEVILGCCLASASAMAAACCCGCVLLCFAWLVLLDSGVLLRLRVATKICVGCRATHDWFLSRSTLQLCCKRCGVRAVLNCARLPRALQNCGELKT